MGKWAGWLSTMVGSVLASAGSDKRNIPDSPRQLKLLSLPAAKGG